MCVGGKKLLGSSSPKRISFDNKSIVPGPDDACYKHECGKNIMMFSTGGVN